MKIKVKSLDDLEKGIEQLLLENRCSFSDDDKSRLRECIQVLRKNKRIVKAKQPPNLAEITRVFELLIRLFVIIGNSDL